MSESPQQRASLLAPMPGDVIAQADIPDPAFAGGAMGAGFGVVPEENTVVAPVSGRITMVADTGHAVGFETADGLQVLLHLGVDTVELKGAPFRLVVAKGDTVQAGDPVGTMDLAAVEAQFLAATSNGPVSLSSASRTPDEARPDLLCLSTGVLSPTGHC